MELILRKPTADDADAITAIEEKCFGVNAWSRSSIEDFIENGFSHVVAAELDGEIVGYAGVFVICGEAEVTNVAVLPEKRRLGIARRMMEKMIETAVSLDSELMMLEVREGNVPARTLYESLGFTPVGKRRGYYTSPREDAVLMTKILDTNKEN